MKILIVTGGSLELSYMKEYLDSEKYDHVIAADSGLGYCDRLGIMPTEILGDFDSLKEKKLLDYYQKQGVPVKTFPARKDFTDTDLAVNYALDILQDQSGEVTILAATGSRLDHTLANIGLLQLFAEKDIEASILDRHNKIRMIQGPCEMTISRKEERPFLSLIACDAQVSGLTISGVSYPLENATLPMYVSLGISNEITQDYARLHLEKGTLLLLETVD